MIKTLLALPLLLSAPNAAKARNPDPIHPYDNFSINGLTETTLQRGFQYSFTLVNTGNGYILPDTCYFESNDRSFGINEDYSIYNELVAPGKEREFTFLSSYKLDTSNYYFYCYAYTDFDTSFSFVSARDFTKTSSSTYDSSGIVETTYTYTFYIDYVVDKTDSDFNRYNYISIIDLEYGDKDLSFFVYYLEERISFTSQEDIGINDMTVKDVKISKKLENNTPDSYFAFVLGALLLAAGLASVVAFVPCAIIVIAVGLTIGIYFIVKHNKKKKLKAQKTTIDTEK